MRSVLVTFLVAAIAFAQGPKPRGKPDATAHIIAAKPNFTYPNAYPALAEIDWKNFEYLTKVYYDEPPRLLRLSRGIHKYVEPNAEGYDLYSVELTFKAVHYLGDPPAFAIVLIEENTCGANCTLLPTAYVFQLKDQRLTLVQTIAGVVHGTPGDIAFDQQRSVLTLRTTDYGAGAHCCPEYLDIVTYRWTGSDFVRTSRKTVPNPDLSTD